MAQPSVAREPSMEEILASIRKIIESNDPGAERGIPSSLPPIYGGDEDDVEDEIELTIEDETVVAASIFAANDERPVDRQPQQAEVPAASVEIAPEAPKNISLADLAARVRASTDRAEQEVAAAEPVRQAAPPAESPLMTSRLAGFRSAAPQSAEQSAPPAAAQPMAVAPKAVPLEARAAEPAVEQEAQPQAPGQGMAPGMELTALVSAEAEAHVARSFGELAAAVDGQQRRSLDEMAEEMLRPMLREWLDDNLPTLVERLVREEIERVARGPRR